MFAKKQIVKETWKIYTKTRNKKIKVKSIDSYCRRKSYTYSMEIYLYVLCIECSTSYSFLIFLSLSFYLRLTTHMCVYILFAAYTIHAQYSTHTQTYLSPDTQCYCVVFFSSQLACCSSPYGICIYFFFLYSFLCHLILSTLHVPRFFLCI